MPYSTALLISDRRPKVAAWPVLVTILSFLFVGCSSARPFTPSALPSLRRDAADAPYLQLSLTQGFTLKAQKLTKDERSVESGAGQVFKELQRMNLQFPIGLKVVAIGPATETVEVDPNLRGIRLLLTAQGAGGQYRMTHINGKPLSSVHTIDEFDYRADAAQPIFLNYKLGEKLRVLDRAEVAKGRRVPP